MIQNLFTCLWITIGITSLIGIIGLVLSILGNTSRKYLQILGELFIFGIICILVVTLTIVIIKPYA